MRAMEQDCMGAQDEANWWSLAYVLLRHHHVNLLILL